MNSLCVFKSRDPLLYSGLGITCIGITVCSSISWHSQSKSHQCSSGTWTPKSDHTPALISHGTKQTNALAPIMIIFIPNYPCCHPSWLAILCYSSQSILAVPCTIWVNLPHETTLFLQTMYEKQSHWNLVNCNLTDPTSHFYTACTKQLDSWQKTRKKLNIAWNFSWIPTNFHSCNG